MPDDSNVPNVPNDADQPDAAATLGEPAVSNGSDKRTKLVLGDLLASIVVFLVALPLCMGIAIASGVPVAYGLITGIVGGLIVGFFAGSPLQVSGPAAGLAVIIAQLVQERGLEVLGITVLLAGVIQLVAGALRLGQWFRAVSPAVIEGMLAGIGVLIFASQFHVMVDDAPKGNGLVNLLTIPQAVAKGLPWPDLADRPERKLIVEGNQTVGALHERQTVLLEEYVSHYDGESADRGFDYDALAVEQREVGDDLRTIATRLDEGGVFAGDRGGTRRTAFEAALAAVDKASTAIGKQGGVAEALDTAETSLLAFERTLKNHDVAAKVGLLTLLVIVVWQFLPAKVRAVPAPLVAVVVATAAAYFLAAPVQYVEIPDSLLDDTHRPTLTTLKKLDIKATLIGAIVIAIVASAETLLCATAVDQLHTGPRTRYDRELFAQGIGNTICGFLGALPMTGVIVRSAANVQAGGKTRMSTIFHGAWLLLLCAFLSGVLKLIPVAALAAILVFTGYRLMGFGKFLKLWRTRRSDAIIFLVTVFMIVATDLLTGVVVGIVLAGGKLLARLSQLSVVRSGDEGGRTVLHLDGSATFVSLPKLASALENVTPGTDVEIDMERLNIIDHSCMELLDSFERQHRASGGTLHIDWPQVRERSDLATGQRVPAGVESPASIEQSGP